MPSMLMRSITMAGGEPDLSVLGVSVILPRPEDGNSRRNALTGDFDGVPGTGAAENSGGVLPDGDCGNAESLVAAALARSLRSPSREIDGRVIGRTPLPFETPDLGEC